VAIPVTAAVGMLVVALYSFVKLVPNVVQLLASPFQPFSLLVEHGALRVATLIASTPEAYQIVTLEGMSMSEAVQQKQPASSTLEWSMAASVIGGILLHPLRQSKQTLVVTWHVRAGNQNCVEVRASVSHFQVRKLHYSPDHI
jgi:hypothetical protein